MPATNKSVSWKFTPPETAKAPPRSRSPSPTSVVNPLVFEENEPVDGEVDVEDVNVSELNGNGPEDEVKAPTEPIPELVPRLVPALAMRLGCAPSDEMEGAIIPMPAPT